MPKRQLKFSPQTCSRQICPLAGVATLFLAAIVLAVAGCASSPEKPDELSGATAAVQPKVITNLSRLSAADTVPIQADTLGPQSASAGAQDRGSAVNEALTHQLAADAASIRYNREPTPRYHGGTRLLNDKARQFSEFSDILLSQTLKAAESLAAEKLEQRRVSADLTPVMLTAVLDREGRLKEIVIDHHSGDLAVDHLFIDACKKGIWSRNPPPAALAADGTYRLRVEGMVYNVSFDRYGEYSYDTEVGLGIL